MIRKILFLGVILAPVSLCATEEMSFLTDLMAPVGTFATLEVTDQTKPVRALTFSYGASAVPARQENIFLRGNNTPFLGEIRLGDSSTLGGEVGKVMIADDQPCQGVESTEKCSIVTGKDLSLKGGALAADKVYLSVGHNRQNYVRIDDTVDAGDVFVFKVAAIKELRYGDGQSRTESGTVDPSGEAFFWRFSGNECPGTEPSGPYILQSNLPNEN